jgi:peptide chain release factor subunit 1
LAITTDRSQEGNQFVKGFGGISGMLRYKVDFNMIADAMDDGDEFYDSDEVTCSEHTTRI